LRELICINAAKGFWEETGFPKLFARGFAMHKNWPEMAAGLSAPLKELRQGAPDVMKGFGAVARAALEAKALDTKTKELIALAIGAFHAEAAVRQGATREEVLETMGMAIYMGAGPSVMYAAQAVEAYDQFLAKARPAAAE
jgi:alkylhydroperoxidase/carboxymuconolactone decarboxylase family protein YurZ